MADCNTVYHHIWQNGKHFKSFKEVQPNDVTQPAIPDEPAETPTETLTEPTQAAPTPENTTQEFNPDSIDDSEPEPQQFVLSDRCGSSVSARIMGTIDRIQYLETKKPGSMCASSLIEDVFRDSKRVIDQKCFAEIQDQYQAFLSDISACPNRCGQPLITTNDADELIFNNDAFDASFCKK